MFSYPNKLEDGEKIWGKDYSALSKSFNTMLDWLYEHHQQRVVGNIDWYADRFDFYNEVQQFEFVYYNFAYIYLLYLFL